MLENFRTLCFFTVQPPTSFNGWYLFYAKTYQGTGFLTYPVSIEQKIFQWPGVLTCHVPTGYKPDCYTVNRVSSLTNSFKSGFRYLGYCTHTWNSVPHFPNYENYSRCCGMLCTKARTMRCELGTELFNTVLLQ